jgi:hypothetical protein
MRTYLASARWGSRSLAELSDEPYALASDTWRRSGKCSGVSVPV